MTRDVLIRISGLQQMDDDASDVEVITAGEYFWKNGKHYVIYDELMEGFDGSTRNTVKITPRRWISTRRESPMPIWSLKRTASA